MFAQLIAQYNKFNTEGVTYNLNENTITEQHFDFENTIIKELKTQVDSRTAPGAKDWDAIDKQWRNGVGGAQKLLPMHVVDVYCANKSFYLPKFTSQPKSSKQVYDWNTRKYEGWFCKGSKLASDFAISKIGRPGEGHWAVKGASLNDWTMENGSHTLAAMTALCEVRTKDFITLKSQHKNRATLNNRHQVKLS